MLSSLSKKSVMRGVVALGLVAAFSGIAVSDAEARHRGRHHAGHSRNNNAGAMIGLGLLGALAIGAIASSNQNQGYQRQGYYEEPRYAPQGAYGYQQQYYAPRPQPRAQYIVETRYDNYGNPYQVRRRCVERYPNNPSGACN